MRTSQAGPWTQIGAAQAPGAAGLNCWDLNGNGVFDLVTEDANGDGVADALDCRGEPGRACWDSNANGVPDPDEDVTGDGIANALDCQGTVGEISSVFLTTALVGVVQVSTSQGPNTAGKAVQAICPANTILTGGGYLVSSASQTVHAWGSSPNGNGWQAQAKNSNESFRLTAYALCATTGLVLGGLP